MGLLFSYQDELRGRASVLVSGRRPDREIVVTGINDACQPVILAGQAPGRSFYPDACDSLGAVSRAHCQGIKKTGSAMPSRVSRLDLPGTGAHFLHYTPFPEREIQRFLGCYGPEAAACRDATPVHLFGVERLG